MQRSELTRYLDELLRISDFADDSSNNGLQFEGKKEVKKVIGAVDASLELLDKAAAAGADFVFVHHGMSWGAEPRRFINHIALELKALSTSDISLYGAHLPLDAHPELGNNIILARMAEALNCRFTWFHDGNPIAVTGNLPRTISTGGFFDRFSRVLNAKGTLYGNPATEVNQVTIVSGCGGSGALEDAIAQGSQLLLTGEMMHQMYHPARENHIAVTAFGHYVTETLGVRAILAHLNEKFGVETEFIDIPTGL